MKLQTRYALIIIAMILGISGFLSVTLLLEFRKASSEIGDTHSRMLERQLTAAASEQAANTAEQLADNLVNPVYFMEMSAIEGLIEVAQAHPDVVAVTVIDPGYRTIHTGDGDLESFGRVLPLSDREKRRLAQGVASEREVDDGIHVVQPIKTGDKVIGAVSLRYSLTSIKSNINDLHTIAGQTEDSAFKRLLELSLLKTLMLVVGGVLLAIYVARMIQRPIERLVAFANDVGRGIFHQQMKVQRSDELGELTQALNDMAVRLDERTREIQFLAYHDSLTRLPNRDYFRERLAEVIKRIRREGRSFSLLFVDIDNFKLINDVYGHSAGDQMLVALAARLRACLGIADGAVDGELEGCGTLLGRLAGDEFIALLEDAGGKVGVAAVSQQILDAIAGPFPWQGNTIAVGVSIGIALYPDDGDDVDTLLRNADAAMYHVKKQGKNHFHFFSPHLDRQAHDQLNLLEDFGRAIDNGELELWYQPQLNMATRQLIGMEALIRWHHPTRGLLFPGAFMPLVERSVHIYRLGEWVIREAVAQLQQWRDTAPQLRMAINLSAVQLLRGSRLLEQLSAAVPTPALARQIDLEITENFFIEAEEKSTLILRELSELGFSIWLDDFGTGFSSLNHLREFPVDGIKIDKSYVAAMVGDGKHRALTTAVVSLAQDLKIKVIAEGVETVEQQRLLRNMGCPVAQGFLFARPKPAAEIEVLLLSRDALFRYCD